MKKPSVQDLVYRRIYPRPRANDPTSLLLHVQRCLVPEVREEVHRYFGGIDCLEAQYPGLDYTFLPHQRRLASFPWHRRLFRVFLELGLTNDEILSLCTWEGTRAAKERFERESHTRIQSTTLEGVEPEPRPQAPRATLHTPRISAPGVFRPTTNGKRRAFVDAEDSDEDEPESIGVHLNQQLLAAADARERGEAARFDQQWEQWMKEALERNDMDLGSIISNIRDGRPFPPTTMTESNVPEASQDQDTTAPDLNTPATLPSPIVPNAQTFDQLHDMLDELQSNNTRIAADTATLAAHQADITRTSPSQANHSRLASLVENLQANVNSIEAGNTAISNYLSRTRTETAR